MFKNYREANLALKTIKSKKELREWHYKYTPWFSETVLEKITDVEWKALQDDNEATLGEVVEEEKTLDKTITEDEFILVGEKDKALKEKEEKL